MTLLTKEDILTIVKQHGHTNVLEWTLEKYSSEMMGYLGEHLTLNVVTESEVLKFFVKCLPRFEKWKAKYIKETTFFEKEYQMLNSLFKKFGGTQKWRPTVYFVKDEVFVFEDVVKLGYSIPSNRDILTFEEVKASVEAMAIFHAQSYIYEETKTRELKRPYRIWEDYSLYLQEPKTTNNWRETGIKAAIGYIQDQSKYKNYPNFDEIVESTMRKLFDDAYTLMEPNSVYRNAVVHRDLWMNNVFFKTDSNGTHALLIDFQTVVYCSPMLDLSSFLYFNTRREFRDRYLDKFLDLYYNTLSQELKASNINVKDIMSRETLNHCYEESVTFGIAQAAIIVPITLIDKKENRIIFSDPERLRKFYEESRIEEFLRISNCDKRYREHLNELFDEIVEKFILVQVF